jgi:Spy/CpxP family protein refolding chaperone
MYRIGVLLAALAAGLLVVGEGQSGDKGDKGTKTKSRLPLFYSQLKLSKEQRSAIESIQSTYNKKMSDLKKEQQRELLKILTPDQRDQLRRLIAEKSGLDAAPKDRKDEGKDKKGG